MTWIHQRREHFKVIMARIEVSRIWPLTWHWLGRLVSLKARLKNFLQQISLQAVEELAHGVDQNFDWETEVAELRRTLGRQQHLQYEHKLWQSWEPAHAGMAEEANRLYDEAFKAQHLVCPPWSIFPLDKHPLNRRDIKTLLKPQALNNKRLDTDVQWVFHYNATIFLAIARMWMFSLFERVLLLI